MKITKAKLSKAVSVMFALVLAIPGAFLGFSSVNTDEQAKKLRNNKD